MLNHGGSFSPNFPQGKRNTHILVLVLLLIPLPHFFFLFFFLHFAKEVDDTTPTTTPSTPLNRRAKIQGSQNNLSPSAIHRVRLSYLKFRTLTYLNRTPETVQQPGWTRQFPVLTNTAYAEASRFFASRLYELNFKAWKQLKRDFMPSASLKLCLALGRKL